MDELFQYQYSGIFHQHHEHLLHYSKALYHRHQYVDVFHHDDGDDDIHVLHHDGGDDIHVLRHDGGDSIHVHGDDGERNIGVLFQQQLMLFLKFLCCRPLLKFARLLSCPKVL